MNPEDEAIDTSADEVLDTAVDTAEVDTPAEETLSMDDTLRAKFRELTTDTEVEEVTPPVETRARGADGKFIEAEKAPVVKTAPVVKAAEAPVVAAPVEKPVAPVAPTDAIAKAPTSWKGTAQAKYEALDPEIKAEVHRREADFHNGIKQYKQDADTFKLLDAEIRPYEAMIRAAGVPPQALIRDLLNTVYQFKTGTPDSKVETLLNVATAWNVDLSLLPSIQEKMAQGQPIVAPEFRQLEQKYNQLHESIQQRDLREQQEREAAELASREEVSNEIRTWAADKPHYEAVKLSMAALIESGQAKNLDDAYDKATWASPEVRGQRLAQQQEADRKLAVEKAAAAKKAASTNVKPRGTPPAKQTAKVGTMEDTIREQYRKLTAAA